MVSRYQSYKISNIFQKNQRKKVVIGRQSYQTVYFRKGSCKNNKNYIKNIVVSNNIECLILISIQEDGKEENIVEKLDKLKDVSSPAGKLYNWNIITK